MKEKTEQLRNGTGRIREKVEEKLREDPSFDPATAGRTALGLIALAAMLLPWIKLDGYQDAMNGAELIAYAFTSPERASLFQVSKIGTLAVLLAPPIVLAANVYGLIRLIQGEQRLAPHLCGAVLPLGMTLLAGAIASSDGMRLAGIPIPGWGIIVTILAQGILFLDAMMEGKD